MKKILLMIPAMLMAVGMQAQTVLTIGTKKGSSYTYTVGTDADSIRIIEGTGIKVYPKNSKESVDFLMSQISYTIVQKNNKTNTNRNTEEDLKKNKEGWRLEFPRFYQGTNVTYEKSYYITDLPKSPVNFSVEWDGSKRANRWTCYQMYNTLAPKTTGRKNKFKADNDIAPEHRSELADYSGSGYSRGHLCPSNDRVCSEVANDQTFYLTNMQPQLQGHNAGVWSHLEQRIKDGWFYTKGTTQQRCDTLYIVKAATIDREADIDGYTNEGNSRVNRLIIPKFFYMALLAYDRKAEKYEAIGIWSPHKSGSVTEFISIDELETRTGIDFFCNLPDNIETEVEKSFDARYWEVTTTRSRYPLQTDEEKPTTIEEE